MASEIPEGSCYSINHNNGADNTLQVILFLAEHPYARFNELAIIHAVNHDAGGRLIRQTLRELVSLGMVKTRTDGEVVFFSLIENMRGLALEMAKVDLHQKRRLLWANLTKGGRTYSRASRRRCPPGPMPPAPIIRTPPPSSQRGVRPRDARHSLP